MGQKCSVDRLPKQLRDKVIELLEDPAMTQKGIVDLINDEAGKVVLRTSSMNRFFKRSKKDDVFKNVTSVEISLFRIADAMEKIAERLEKH
jgi:hypothetical protein